MHEILFVFIEYFFIFKTKLVVENGYSSKLVTVNCIVSFLIQMLNVYDHETGEHRIGPFGYQSWSHAALILAQSDAFIRQVGVL